MARSPIEIGIASETRAFRQGVESGIIEPLKDADKALTDLGKNGGADKLDRELEIAERATESLKNETKEVANAIERSFRDSYDSVKRESTQATSKMKEGFDEAKTEAQQSGREAAASFGGGFDDVADFVQETLANALAGFGPIGAAAGVALAAVLGTALANATQTQEKLADAREKAAELASLMYENGGKLPLQERVEELFNVLAEEVAPSGWIQSALDGVTDYGDRLDGLRRIAERTGRPISDLIDALSGSDLSSTKRELKAVTEELEKMNRNPAEAWVWETGPLEDYKRQLEGTVKQFELADQIVKSGDFLDRKRVDDLAAAWQGAQTSAGNYISETEEGLTTFDWESYLSDFEATIAAADEMKGRLVGLPDSIRAEAERIFSEQGAVAANEYTKAYENASAADRGRFEAAARSNGDAAGRAQATALRQAFGNPVLDATVRVNVDDRNYRNWQPTPKTGRIIMRVGQEAV